MTHFVTQLKRLSPRGKRSDKVTNFYQISIYLNDFLCLKAREIFDLFGDLINKGEVNLEKFLARIAPITKYEMFRDIVGAPSYYEKD